MKLITELDGSEKVMAGAAFQFYPRVEEVWVAHTMDGRLGCVRCGFGREDFTTESTEDTEKRDFWAGFSCGEVFQLEQPRARFLVDCAPRDLNRRAPVFLRAVVPDFVGYKATVQVLNAKDAKSAKGVA